LLLCRHLIISVFLNPVTVLGKSIFCPLCLFTWRKLHNEELHNLYYSPSIIRMTKSRRMRWAGHVARMGENRNVYGALVGKPEGKRPLKRTKRWRLDKIKMDLRDIGWDGLD
jgi:hypothetical protein